MFNVKSTKKSPSAALFFCTYETIKSTLSSHVNREYAPYIHMGAASIGEMVNIDLTTNEMINSTNFLSFPGGMFDSSSSRDS